MKLRKLHLTALTALLLGTLVVVGCGDDEPPTAPEDDPAMWCNADLCAANETLRNECTEEFNRCVASGGDSTDCGVAARASTCSGGNPG